MSDALRINAAIVIPEDEIEITTSRSGGAGGQHVNKSDTRITLRWNVEKTNIFTPEQKERVVQKLRSRLTLEGDLIIHSSASRSQHQNKISAFHQLVQVVRKAMHVPKKRVATKVPSGVKEKRLRMKAARSGLKKMRSVKHYGD